MAQGLREEISAKSEPQCLPYSRNYPLHYLEIGGVGCMFGLVRKGFLGWRV